MLRWKKGRSALIRRSLVCCIGVLLCAGRSWAGFTSVETIDSTSVEKVLQNGTVYRVSESVSLVAGTNRPALSVASGATAVLLIEPDVTLTVTGGVGAAYSPAGAGICVPIDSTLIVCGSGTLNAVGGAGADGENGHDGKSASFNFDTGYATVGTGGAGGYGGGGPGAGIGGCGGAGGLGAGRYTPELERYTDPLNFSYDGFGGYTGDNGIRGETSGKVYLLGAVKVNVTGGDPGEAGVKGFKGASANDSGSGWTYYYFAAGGGAGGGGGQGTQAYAIGGGGGGGGGGGSGGDGPTTVKSWNWLVTDVGRDGGNCGERGEFTTGSWGETHDGISVYAREGGHGGWTAATGDAGLLYLSSSAVLNQLGGLEYPSESFASAETHPAMTYTVSFDTLGGGDIASMESQLGMLLPALPTLPVREGLVFNGFWTEPYGRGVRCYDSSGEPILLLDPGDLALYADWIVGDSFVVTTEEDLSPEEATARGLVSLRSAIAEINGKVVDGARNLYTISFASGVSNVAVEQSPSVVGLSDADSLSVVIDGTAGRDASDAPVVLGLQDENARFSVKDASLTVRNLTFSGIGAQPSATTAPDVFKLDGAAALTAENCSFNDFDRPILILVPATSTDTRRSVRIIDSSFQNWKGQSGQKLLSAYCPAAFAADAVFANCTFWQCSGSGDSAMIIAAGEKAAMVDCTVCNSQLGKDAVLIQNGAHMAGCLVDDVVQVSGDPAAQLRDVYCRAVQLSGTAPTTNNVVTCNSTERYFGVDKTVSVTGVVHHVVNPVQGIVGSFVWHDAGWDNIAVSSDRGGTDRAPVFGDAAKADILRLTDEVGNVHPAGADWAPPSGALLRATPPPSLIVEDWGDPVLDEDSDYVSPMSLRGAVSASIRYPWLVNSNTLDRTITFAPTVAGLTLTRALDIRGTPGEDAPVVVIDGAAGRPHDITAASIALMSDAVISAQDASLTLRNLKFRKSLGLDVSQTAPDVLSLRDESALTMENCSFTGFDRTVLSLRSDDDSDGSRSVRILGCCFRDFQLLGRGPVFAADCPAEGADDFVLANCTFGGISANSKSMIVCSGAKSALVNCTVDAPSCDTPVALTDGARMAECVIDGYVWAENTPWLRDVYCLSVDVSGSGCESNNVVEAEAYDREASVFFDSYSRLERDCHGVAHETIGVTPGILGSFVWHDADWNNIAVSSDRGGVNRVPVLGDATKADILRLTDEVGNSHPVDADWAPPAGALVRATPSASLVVAFESGPVPQTTVSEEALQKTISAAVEYPWLVNPDTLDRTITFDRRISGMVLEHPIFIGKDETAPTSPFVIDGEAGRHGLQVMVDVRTRGRFSLNDGTVTFRNFQFQNLISSDYTPPAGEGFFSFSGSGALTVENCYFDRIGQSVFAFGLNAGSGKKCSARFLKCFFDYCYDTHGGSVLQATCPAGGAFDFVAADCTLVRSQLYAFGNGGGAISCSGAKAVIANCTVYEQEVSCPIRVFDGARAVGCLVDEIVQTDGTPYLRDVYCLKINPVNASAPKYSPDSQNVVEAVAYDRTSLTFFDADRTNYQFVRGVRHLCCPPAQAVVGSFVWHDAGWDNIAVSPDRGGVNRVALLGDAAKADILRVTDEVGAVHPVDAAWAPPAGSVMRDTPPPSLVVETEDDVEPLAWDKYASPISIRSALAALVEFPWLVNTNTLTHAISFVPDVRTIMLRDNIVVSGQGASVTIDGNAGRGDLPAVKLTNRGSDRQRAFIVKENAQLEFDNLMFEDFGCGSENRGAVVENEAGSARIRVVNCAFRNVVLPAYGSVLKICGDSAKLFVEGCSFYGITSSANDTRVIDFEPDYPGYAARAVVSRCTFANNQGTAFYSLCNGTTHNSVVSCSTFYGNSDYAVLSQLTDIYSSLMLGSGKADLFVTEDGTNVVYDSWAYKLPSGTTRRIVATRGAIGVKCSKDPATYLYMNPETNVLHGVEHLYYRPRMQSIPELGTSSPKAAGAFLAHNDDWTTVDVKTKYSSLDSSLTPFTVDFVEEDLDPDQLPCAGAVFYGEEEILEPIVTTTDPADAKDYKMSVEEAFALALSDPSKYTVTFSDELYDSNGVAVVGFHNLMTVSNAAVVIKAPEGKTTILAYVPKLRTDGHGADEVARTHAFYVQESGWLTLEGLIISNAVGNTEGIAQRHYERATSGGAILCYGVLNASDCVFTCCEAGPQRYLAENGVPTGFGGAVCTVGPKSIAHLNDCTFEYCHAACGGAVASVDGGHMYVSNGIFRNNVAWTTLLMQGFGGAAYREGNDSVLDLGTNPVFEGNESHRGTNIWADVVERLVDENGHTVISVPEEASEEPLAVSEPAPLRAASPASAAAFASRLTVAGRDWYTATADGTKVDFVLNAKATPAIDAAAAEGNFTATVGNVKPGLSYALGWSDTPDGDFAEHLKAANWVRAGDDGSLPELVAPKGASGSRFYRVLVK